MYYVLKDKKVVPVEHASEWNAFFCKTHERIMAKTIIGDSEVSTVFIGIMPILFETMIFGGERDGYCERHDTYAAAINCHNELVEMIKNETSND